MPFSSFFSSFVSIYIFVSFSRVGKKDRVFYQSLSLDITYSITGILVQLLLLRKYNLLVGTLSLHLARYIPIHKVTILLNTGLNRWFNGNVKKERLISSLESKIMIRTTPEKEYA